MFSYYWVKNYAFRMRMAYPFCVAKCKSLSYYFIEFGSAYCVGLLNGYLTLVKDSHNLLLAFNAVILANAAI